MWHSSGKKLLLLKGDISRMDVDAVVNAAHKSLILGEGVAGAIRRLGGPSIQEECNRKGPIPVGEAVMTGAGNLKARHVIHAAGPVFGEGDEDEKLRLATFNSLQLANKHRLKNIAFPAISTGIFHFPITRCSEIMLCEAMDFLKNHPFPEEIIFCLFEDDALELFSNTLERLAYSTADKLR